MHNDAENVVKFAPLMTAHPITTVDFLLKRHNTHYPPLLGSSLIEYVFVGSEALAAESVLLRELDTLENSIESFRIVYLKLWTLYRAMREMHGGDALHKMVAPMRDIVDVVGAEDSIEYLYRAADSIDVELGMFVRDWLTTDTIPGFIASEVKSRVVDAPDSDWTHHASFDIRNDRDASGVVQFVLGGELDDIEVGPSVEVPSNSSYRVNLYSKDPVIDVSIQTFHSLNAGLLSRQIPLIGDSDDVTVRIRQMVEPSNWQPQVDDYIVVDNLDDGIELIGTFKDRPPFVERIGSWMNVFPVPPSIQRNGVVHSMTQFGGRSDNWEHIELWTAYGRYRQTAWETFSESARTVRFTTELPKAGKWILEYHFPFLYAYWRPYGRYNFVLRDNVSEQPISIDAKDLSGWVDLGTFEVVGPSVQLDLISVEPSDSRKIADAVRWRPVED